jgi:anti-sigma regulatory factor (Ser/Thr protein kinase)
LGRPASAGLAGDTGAAPAGFSHEAAAYGDDGEFLAATVPFVLEGLQAGEPVLVALARRGEALLKRELGRHADGVQLIDMESVGRNPARIIPVWRQFVRDRPADGRPIRGIGEPAWPGRDAGELAECHLHEALLNAAFASSPAFRMLCPYDATALDQAVLREARRTHPLERRGGRAVASATFDPDRGADRRFRRRLPEPASVAAEIVIDAAMLPASLPHVRRLIAAQAASGGLDTRRCDDLVVAADEIIVNAVRHGGGSGRMRLWREAGRVVCEVRDSGRLDDPMVGRRLPDRLSGGGRGLWIVNQLCDLVQIRSSVTGTAVRIHVGP